jgi:hypothetical protein
MLARLTSVGRARPADASRTGIVRRSPEPKIHPPVQEGMFSSSFFYTLPDIRAGVLFPAGLLFLLKTCAYPLFFGGKIVYKKFNKLLDSSDKRAKFDNIK